jgi:drug/metabolite transporter (DMT)-like permease
VGTYAYVNPIVAVFLGWLILGEPLTGRTLAAAAIIISGVVLITLSRRAPAPAKEQAVMEEDEETECVGAVLREAS